MNQRSLQQIVTDAVERERADGVPPESDVLLQRVLADPDMAIIMEGYRMHDRKEGMDKVIERDIRRMITHALGNET